MLKSCCSVFMELHRCSCYQSSPHHCVCFLLQRLPFASRQSDFPTSFLNIKSVKDPACLNLYLLAKKRAAVASSTAVSTAAHYCYCYCYCHYYDLDDDGYYYCEAPGKVPPWAACLGSRVKWKPLLHAPAPYYTVNGEPRASKTP